MYLGGINYSCSQIKSVTKPYGQERCSFVAYYWTFVYYGHFFHMVLSTTSGRISHQVDLCPSSCICVFNNYSRNKTPVWISAGWRLTLALLGTKKKISSDLNSTSQVLNLYYIWEFSPQRKVRPGWKVPLTQQRWASRRCPKQFSASLKSSVDQQ